MHRFFVNPQQINGSVVRFNDGQAHQMRRVLRMTTGQQVIVLDGSGAAYDVTLQQVTTDSVVGQITRQATAQGEPHTYLTLYQSLLKRDKFEWVLQKGTEIGVSRFVPVITRRTLVRDATSVTPDKEERWRRIILEAAEQSGRGRLPELAEPQQFPVAVSEAAASNRIALIAWEESTGKDIASALRDLSPLSYVGLFIGPEGGYDPEEITLAQAEGLVSVTLGSRILRTETAALVGPALVLHELGDMA
ncbi:MAG: RsmE family RNA methyltransferase [Chloroflexota bacterium]